MNMTDTIIVRGNRLAILKITRSKRVALRALSTLCLGVIGGLLVSSEAKTCSASESLASHSESHVIASVNDGNWSEPLTWDARRIPASGDIVLVRSQHKVRYDVESESVIRSIHVSGCLTFATDKNTRLDVGLLRVEAGDTVVEEGFDCGVHHTAAHTGPTPELLIGTDEIPIESGRKCLIRLHAISGTDPASWPAIVCCGGRMEIHGAPLNRTWVKLSRTADVGASRLFLADAVEGWNHGDMLVITGTARQEPSAGVQTEHVTDRPMSEIRYLSTVRDAASGASMTSGAKSVLQLDDELAVGHRGGEYSAEVANLTRNVVVESAEPESARGHTMYHHGSRGSISYAEFRHLGKDGVLGRYPIHFHLAADSMRGSSVVGASIWDSHNRWLTIHGTQYLVVRDNVGYQSIGHGFFLEDGTEAYNILDRNLAIQALVGKPLPKQVLPYDRNDGAGFWWANSLNAFTRNVAVECDQHGFRFEAEETHDFDPHLKLLQPDGETEIVDIRKLPFIQFDDNEAHCHRRFGLNLGGIRGLTYQQFADEHTSETFADSIGGTTEGIGPEAATPFVIRNFKAWDTHWAFHTFCPAVVVDGLDVFDCNYGIWRSIVDLHQYDNLSFRQIHSHAIFFPMGGHGPAIHMDGDKPSFPNLKRKDNFPPATMITGVRAMPSERLRVTGVTADNERVVSVDVAGYPARSIRDHFAEWEAEVPSDVVNSLTAFAVDNAGNVEPRPHKFSVPSSSHHLGH